MSNKFIEAMNQLNGHGLCRIIAKTEIKLLVKGRTTKIPLPEKFIGLTHYYQIVASVGHSYHNSVKNQISKAGGNPDLWEEEDCKYSERDPDSTNGIVRRHKVDNDTKYLRCYPELMGATHGKSFYLNGKGDEISLEEVEAIKSEYFPKKEGSLKQSKVMEEQEIGLEKEVKPRNLLEKNIIYVKRGDFSYKREVSDDIIDMFTLLNDGKCPVAC